MSDFFYCISNLCTFQWQTNFIEFVAVCLHGQGKNRASNIGREREKPKKVEVAVEILFR